MKEVLWLVAFVGGFSDQFGDTILRTLVGQFGGDPKGDIVSLDDGISVPNIASLTPVFDTYCMTHTCSTTVSCAAVR
jgi:hypothetical protein